jgi:hypothetical protein
MINRSFSFFLSGILLFVFACKTTKPVTDSGPAVKLETPSDLFTHLERTKPTYKNLNIKFSAQIKTRKNGENTIKGKLKIGRDSVVWISAMPMGIEIARILATQNQVSLIYFLDKKYAEGDYSLLGKQAGYQLNYAMLEAALTASPVFTLPEENFRLTDLKKQGYFFSPTPKADFERITEARGVSSDNTKLVQAMWFSAQGRLTRNVLYDGSADRLLDISYTTFALAETDFLPTQIKVRIRTPEETAEFTIEYTKTESNVTEQEYPFTVPNSFSPLEIK